MVAEKRNHVLWLTRANPRNVMLLKQTDHRHSWLLWPMGHALVCWDFVNCKSSIASTKLDTKTKAQNFVYRYRSLVFHSGWVWYYMAQNASGVVEQLFTICSAVKRDKEKSRTQNLRERVPSSICLLVSEKLFCVCWDWIAETDGKAVGSRSP